MNAHKRATQEGIAGPLAKSIAYLGMIRGGLFKVGAKENSFALGLDDYLDDFAKKFNANTWKSFSDQENWKPQVLDKILDPKQKVLFNLDGVDVWKEVDRASSGRGGPTDWELLKIYENPQSWSTIDFYKNGAKVENPFL